MPGGNLLPGAVQELRLRRLHGVGLARPEAAAVVAPARAAPVGRRAARVPVAGRDVGPGVGRLDAHGRGARLLRAVADGAVVVAGIYFG